ncbi:MAG: homocysteine S-methyltransferase family protein [Anaerolineales bacterium]|jgi:S-methylmethionine-dependent homocysteine/selenocysteine methylase|nr:homocysteine S-methyltransferase family protein [Anaerolineales bacterium]HJN41265.1 homocysteine S-methyltransferase family protein [Anaerolineales bacterium]|tara:strand:+ start:1407 stop:2312 length:906 start_codon:yes stop_codon:yes gene_type:complete
MTSSAIESTQSSDIRQQLRFGLLLDGATGTELYRRGVDISLPLWSARAILEAPKTLLQIHVDYLRAGADIITANTFRTHRRNLKQAGLGERAQQLTRRAVEIARRAIESTGSRALVAGAIAPLEDSYSPQRTPPAATLAVEHSVMANCLAACGVDALLVETMNSVREAVAATRAAVATGRPTLVSVVCGRDARLLSGEPLAAAAKALTALQPDALLINCAPAPELHRPLAELRAHTTLPVGAYGNVGYLDDDGNWVQTDAVKPQAYAAYARHWRAGGATLIGGCCGTTPAHIEALRGAFSA